MAWHDFNTPKYERLIAVELAHNHGYHFVTYKDEVFLESLAKDDEDCQAIDGIGDPLSPQPPIPTQPSPPKLSPKDASACAAH